MTGLPVVRHGNGLGARGSIAVGLSTVSALVTVWFGLRAGQAWHSRNLPLEDGLGTFYSVGVARQTADAAGIIEGAQVAIGQGPYVLQPLVAAFLHRSLPSDWSVGAILDGLWVLIATAALGGLFWRHTRSVFWAPLLSVVPLLHPVLLASPFRGLISLHPDFVGYTLSVAVIALLLSSHHFRRGAPTILSGLLLGCLVLGRWATAVLVVFMCIPIGWIAFRGKRRFARLRGAFLFLAALGLTSGWWLPQNLRGLFQYLLVWYGREGGSIGSLDLQSIPAFLYLYVAEVLGGRSAFSFLLLLLMLSAVLTLRTRRLGWRDLNWPLLWMSLGPLALLLTLRSNYAGYAYPASLGVYLLFLFPTRTGRRPIVCASPVGWVFATAAVIAWLVSLGSLHRLGAGADRDKAEALRLVEAVAHCEARPCSVGVAYWGALNAPNLANLLIYDRKAPAALAADGQLPGWRGVEYIIDGSFAFPPDSLRDKSAMVPRCQNLLVVLSQASWRIQTTTPFPYHWSRWARLSEAALASGLYEGSETVYTLRPWETVHVLRRAPGAPPCGERKQP